MSRKMSKAKCDLTISRHDGMSHDEMISSGHKQSSKSHLALDLFLLNITSKSSKSHLAFGTLKLTDAQNHTLPFRISSFKSHLAFEEILPKSGPGTPPRCDTCCDGWTDSWTDGWTHGFAWWTDRLPRVQISEKPRTPQNPRENRQALSLQR